MPTETALAGSRPQPTAVSQDGGGTPVVDPGAATPTPIPLPTSTEPKSVAEAVSPYVTNATLLPASVSPGDPLSATVSTRGDITRIEMYLGSGAPGSPGPKTFVLTDQGDGTWIGTGTAPSVAGMYHYTVGMFTRSGRFVVDNDNWNVQVGGSPTSAPAVSAAPLPADIPLAPPFSYGDPVPAQFNAEGKSVNGSEVVSNSRPDVPASAIADFYQAHLPRAGWTVDSSTTPSSGSFSITASKAGANGTRVCIVQYSGSAVHILYGTAG